MVLKTEVNLMEDKWNYVIILDACRFDYFKEVYRDFFPYGEVKKKTSNASCTKDWIKLTFKKKYEDVIYISSNPHINSKIKIKSFDANRYFNKIIDVWDIEWDNELGTVHPSRVNYHAMKTIFKYPNKKLIIHYMQPHYPYLSYGNITKRTNFGVLQKNNVNNIFIKILKKLIGINNTWKIRSKLGLDPKEPIEAIVYRYGQTELIKAYKNNLKIVLYFVKKLINNLSGTIIITSDHGELLGEYGEYGHPCRNLVSFLIDVPYMKIEKKRM